MVRFYRNRPQAGAAYPGAAWEDESDSGGTEGMIRPAIPGAVGGAALPKTSTRRKSASKRQPVTSKADNHVPTYRPKGTGPNAGTRIGVHCSCGWTSGRTWAASQRRHAASAFNDHRNRSGTG